MYNLDEFQLKRIQYSILGYYQTSAENRYRPEMSMKDAVSIFDRTIGQNDTPTLEKTSIIAYLQRDLLNNSKLATAKGMYRAS